MLGIYARTRDANSSDDTNYPEFSCGSKHVCVKTRRLRLAESVTRILATGSVQRHSDFGGNYADIFDLRGQNAVAKFQAQTACGEDISFDRAAAPSAAVDAHLLRGGILAIEPATRNPIHIIG